MPRIYLSVAEAVAIQHLRIEKYAGVHAVRDKGLPESAVFRPRVGYHANAAEEAAALMESLANNHPFFDGNKRVAFAATRGFCRSSGTILQSTECCDCNHDELYRQPRVPLFKNLRLDQIQHRQNLEVRDSSAAKFNIRTQECRQSR